LAAYLAVRHFYFLLEARDFHILTDHKTLIYALHWVSELWSARQQRHLSYLAEFTVDICRVARKDNVVTDVLSRPAGEAAGQPNGAFSKGGRPITGRSVPPSTPQHQTETSTPSFFTANRRTVWNVRGWLRRRCFLLRSYKEQAFLPCMSRLFRWKGRLFTVMCLPEQSGL
jgi:hypothetical protein